jgi:hypothetical protein
MSKLQLICLLAMLSIGTSSFADSNEAEVLKALSTYMDARNTRDFKTVVRYV